MSKATRAHLALGFDATFFCVMTDWHPYSDS
jgi:hypothetical protein